MQIDIGERIAGKQDGPSLIIERPPRAPWIVKNEKKITLWPLYKQEDSRPDSSAV